MPPPSDGGALLKPRGGGGLRDLCFKKGFHASRAPFSIRSKPSEKALRTRIVILPYVFMGTVLATALRRLYVSSKKDYDKVSMCEVTDEQPSEQVALAAQADGNSVSARFAKAREKAVRLFPLETWREMEERIFIACGREPLNKNQQQVLEKELVQARILTAHRSTVYLLPEITDPARDGVKHPDAVVDGYLMEFKTITGGINQIGHRFRESRKKADHVFFKIDSLLSKEEVIKTLEGVILQKDWHDGQIVAYFTETARLYFWNVSDLR
jgi:hypothetical protein